MTHLLTRTEGYGNHVDTYEQARIGNILLSMRGEESLLTDVEREVLRHRAVLSRLTRLADEESRIGNILAGMRQGRER